MKKPDPSSLLTSAEVAALLRVHPKHVYRLLRQGLPARRAGGKWLFSRDEVLEWSRRRSPPAAEPAKPPPPLLAANGDLAVELLLWRLVSRGLPLLGFVQADRASGLEHLRRGRVLAAGWHGEQPPEGAEGLARIHLVRREVGLVARPGQQSADLAGLQRARLASRPATAGIRVHFDAELRRQGLDPAALHQRAVLFASHREVVCAVARGEADFGLATRAWASRVGLGFVSLGWEPYSLVLSAIHLGEPAVARLCEEAQSRAFHEDLEAVAGYDPGGAGDIRFDLGAAVPA